MDKREAWRSMTSSHRWQAAKEFNKKDWIGLDFFNSGRAMDHHSEDPHFTIATSPTTDDDAQKDTHTIPVATDTPSAQPQGGKDSIAQKDILTNPVATDVEPFQSSSCGTEVVVQREAFEQVLLNTEHLTQAVIFDFAFEESAAATNSISSTAQRYYYCCYEGEYSHESNTSLLQLSLFTVTMSRNTRKHRVAPVVIVQHLRHNKSKSCQVAILPCATKAKSSLTIAEEVNLHETQQFRK